MPERGEDRPALRLSFTLPGSASLGAFQAGAMAALSEAIEALRSGGRPVRVDAVGGASAGSIVALFFAHGLTEGLDIPELLHQAWVEKIDVGQLAPDRSDTPLGFAELTTEIESFLRQQAHGAEPPDIEPVMVHIALTNLLGLTYPIETGSSRSHGITYADWAQFEFRPGSGLEQVLEPEGRAPLDFALASATHPAAFAPRPIDRSEDRETYEANGIENFPEGGVLWYTDGALVESEPVGRVIACADRAGTDPTGRDDNRVHLVIDPRSSGPSGADEWADADADPTWLSGLRRAASIVPTQALQEDLRRVAKNNDRLAQIDRIVGALGSDVDARTVADLAEEAGIEVDDPSDASATLRHMLEQLAGVAGKTHVAVEVITPLEVDGDDDVTDLLAGDMIAAFGGFLHQPLRANDFALGWCAARAWLDDGLARHGVDADEVTRCTAAVDAHHLAPDQRPAAEENALDLRARWRLTRLAGRLGRILVRSAAPGVPDWVPGSGR